MTKEGVKLKKNMHIYIFNLIYKLCKVSLYFFVYLLKGGIVYGLIPATASMLETIKQVLEGEDEVALLYKMNSTKYTKYRLQSFFFVLLFLLLYMGIFLINRSESNAALVITVILIYFLCLFALLFVYSIIYTVTKNLPYRHIIGLSFISIIRHFDLSIIIVIMLSALYFSLKVNVLFFIVCSPFLFGLCLLFVSKRMTSK